MATKFRSQFSKAEPFSDTTATIALAATTGLTYTVPGTSANQYTVTFSWPYNASVWVGFNSTAVLPTPGTIVSGRSVRNPDTKFVRGGDVLSFISSSIITDAGLELFEINA